MPFQQGKLLGRMLTGLLLCGCTAAAQELYPVVLSQQSWHGEERSVRYHPEGKDFVIHNGSRRFNRALYGTHTAFRVEAGDLPEFALYMPGMGGNLQIGIARGTKSIWLIKAKDITTRYTPGKMSYEIRDPLLGKGTLHVTLLALADAEGLILKSWLDIPAEDIQLVYAFGGASGKKFSRSGDMGPDPESSFYLHPEDCTTNQYKFKEDAFSLKYAKNTLAISGMFPAKLKLSDAGELSTPLSFLQSSTTGQLSGNTSSQASVSSTDKPAVSCVKALTAAESQYVLIREGTSAAIPYSSLAGIFDAAEASRKKIAGRIQVNTPDPYINTIGAAISIASDAIWEEPSYLHGAVGWRMRLNGWRGPYTADPLGWHDRARTHFAAYAKSQVLTPLTGPVVPDTAFHLARHQEKMGTSMFSSGYISRDPEGKSVRPHHYDMNLVYIDELLWHFNWSGDLHFVKEMWPVLKRHLDWEKRNFDPDNDGLYDAYAVIWASDALYYSGGAVTHSSAYNYRANVMAARIAALIGEPAQPYLTEAAKILKAMNASLWMPGAGVFAEYKDALGLKQLHPSAALWTVYHSIDSDVPDAFQAYQSLRYIDEEIPHIPVKAKGLEDGQFYTLSTTSWMPYTWSLNNVVMAESMHTALANWQAGRNEEGFKLFKSELLADMYLGGSPGNFVQISHYDAVRGEAYRDFADPIGISSRALVEGLFGIVPDALAKSLVIRPGFPQSWRHASIVTPDIDFQFKRTGKTDRYLLKSFFATSLSIKLQVKVQGEQISTVTVNGSAAKWKNIPSAIGLPMIEIDIPHIKTEQYSIQIVWKGEPFKKIKMERQYAVGDQLQLHTGSSISVTAVNDPQKVFSSVKFHGSSFSASLGSSAGDISARNDTTRGGSVRNDKIQRSSTGNDLTQSVSRTAFIQLKMNGFSWWYPVSFDLAAPVNFSPATVQERNKLLFAVANNRKTAVKGMLTVNGFEKEIIIPAGKSVPVSINNEFVQPGTNLISFINEDKEIFTGKVVNWNVDQKQQQRSVDLSLYFNADLTQIFKNKYLTPRPQQGPTLQLPWQGIGDWPHALDSPEIDDSGLRTLAGKNNEFSLPQGIRFSTPGNSSSIKAGTKTETVTETETAAKPINQKVAAGVNGYNILFSSRWDNYPFEKEVPLSGKAAHAYLLMAGSTNPMQSQFDNGKVIITYTDGSSSVLILRNPESWWPIQEDYYTDGFAFNLKQPRPPRVHLKTGVIDLGFNRANNESTANDGIPEIATSGHAPIENTGPDRQTIPGGAATVLDLPLDKTKDLKSLRLVTLANDVVIGLMAVTLTL